MQTTTWQTGTAVVADSTYCKHCNVWHAGDYMCHTMRQARRSMLRTHGPMANGTPESTLATTRTLRAGR